LLCDPLGRLLAPALPVSEPLPQRLRPPLREALGRGQARPTVARGVTGRIACAVVCARLNPALASASRKPSNSTAAFLEWESSTRRPSSSASSV
jgi:hypothetical protein